MKILYPSNKTGRTRRAIADGGGTRRAVACEGGTRRAVACEGGQDFGELSRAAITEPDATDRPVGPKRSASGCVLLGVLARQALIAEAELTPKPALVDRRGSGAHADLSLAIMRRSALAIEPFIRRMAIQSMDERPSARLRATLAATGRAAENAMLRGTNGSNTHKGAIWTLGLLAAAAAINETSAGRFNSDAVHISRTASLIASFKDAHQTEVLSHGQMVAKRFGVTGARGEAMKGFPHIIEVGLPALRARRKAQASEPVARLDAMLSIMARLDDTCLLYRGGLAALQAAKEGAAAVISAGGAGSSRGRELLFALDHRLLALGVSPGGSADLLAGTLFLDAVERHQTKIRASEMDTRTLTDPIKILLLRSWVAPSENVQTPVIGRIPPFR